VWAEGGGAILLAVAALTGHTAVNAALLRRPPTDPSTVDERVAVLLPVRDEAHRIEPCLRSVLGQRGVPGLEIVVLDDGSADGTGDLVRRLTASDSRVRVIDGRPPPPGWLGKPYACHQLAAASTAPVLVFVDADVVLRPYAVASAVALLDGFDLVSPYPRMVAVSAAERLVQPLLAWSWLTFLPLRAMERSHLAALAAAGGQFLVLRREGYRRSGGHAAVRDRILEDVELARAIKRSGGRIALADGSALASCRMYTCWRDLADGLGKSLWAAFGSSAGALAVVLALWLLYLAPPAVAIGGALTGSVTGLLTGLGGYLLGAAGRVLSARATGGRSWPDSLAHPLSIALFGRLVVRSLAERRRGRLRWKGRPLDAAQGNVR
jgi:glycosyltransferase involved in cell wall biosynthesis